jgi:hypothetical protein
MAGSDHTPARAASLATTESGAPVHWHGSEIVLRAVAPTADTGVPSNAWLEALRASARAWNEALRGCDVPRLRIDEMRDDDARIAPDGVNRVVLRTGSWCPTRRVDPDDCYDPALAALTHLHPRRVPGHPRDGELREVDLEVNAVHFRWSPEGERPDTKSLRAILAHELGHVLGLADAASSGPDPRGSIMYPGAVESGRPSVLAPGPAEVASLCAAYAHGRTNARGERSCAP